MIVNRTLVKMKDKTTITEGGCYQGLMQTEEHWHSVRVNVAGI